MNPVEFVWSACHSVVALAGVSLLAWVHVIQFAPSMSGDHASTVRLFVWQEDTLRVMKLVQRALACLTGGVSLAESL